MCGYKYECDLDMKVRIELGSGGKAKSSGQGGDGGKSKTPYEQTQHVRVCGLALGVLSANVRISANLEVVGTWRES